MTASPSCFTSERTRWRSGSGPRLGDRDLLPRASGKGGVEARARSWMPAATPPASPRSERRGRGEADPSILQRRRSRLALFGGVENGAGWRSAGRLGRSGTRSRPEWPYTDDLSRGSRARGDVPSLKRPGEAFVTIDLDAASRGLLRPSRDPGVLDCTRGGSRRGESDSDAGAGRGFLRGRNRRSLAGVHRGRGRRGSGIRESRRALGEYRQGRGIS